MADSRQRYSYDPVGVRLELVGGGACGFIASRLIEFLLNEGHRVIGIDNINDAYSMVALLVQLIPWPWPSRLVRPDAQAAHEDER